DRAATHEALAELTAVGLVLAPGEPGPGRDTSLGSVVRGALRARLSEAQAEQLAAKVEQGALSLAELEGLLERGAGPDLGVLATIYGVAALPELALAFLASDAHDRELASRGLSGELARLLGEALGAELSAITPAELRAQLAR